jgi:hypothetical protein
MVTTLASSHPVHMVTSTSPETDLERELLDTAELVDRLALGVPRSCHPEGRVAEHVSAMIAAVAAEDEARIFGAACRK